MPRLQGCRNFVSFRRYGEWEESCAKLTSLLAGNSQAMLRNAASGEEARLSKPSIGKLLSNSAVKKSMDNGFSREQHYAAVSDIGSLFANAVKVLEHADKKGDPSVSMHRFAVSLNFDNAIAYITVRETRIPKHGGKRVYSTELMEIEKFGGMLESVRKNPVTFPAPNFNVENIKKISSSVTHKIQNFSKKSGKNPHNC